MRQEIPTERISISEEEEVRMMAQETERSIEHAEGALAFWTTLLEKLDAEKHDDEQSDNAYHALRNYLLMNISDMAKLLDDLTRHARAIARLGN